MPLNLRRCPYNNCSFTVLHDFLLDHHMKEEHGWEYHPLRNIAKGRNAYSIPSPFASSNAILAGINPLALSPTPYSDLTSNPMSASSDSEPSVGTSALLKINNASYYSNFNMRRPAINGSAAFKCNLSMFYKCLNADIRADILSRLFSLYLPTRDRLANFNRLTRGGMNIYFDDMAKQDLDRVLIPHLRMVRQEIPRTVRLHASMQQYDIIYWRGFKFREEITPWPVFTSNTQSLPTFVPVEPMAPWRGFSDCVIDDTWLCQKSADEDGWEDLAPWVNRFRRDLNWELEGLVAEMGALERWLGQISCGHHFEAP
ncbi:hypothetical protein FH972_025522 [Carpinus fangiana]|uniref:Uncharacterized protein n=1 Tax=Carpinus fangiana TaxID=176857 RepID=A0A5N6L1N1_9ROSI|nr:hypothetical protein FH972_025522 [Carpinus fangiana]